MDIAQQPVRNYSFRYYVICSTKVFIPLWSILCFTTILFSCHSEEEEDPNTVSLLQTAISETKLMDSCCIKGQNRDFYLHKYNAEKILARFDDAGTLSSYGQRLYAQAYAGKAFAMADYLWQVGRYGDARDVMKELSSNTTLNLYSDTTLWLNFLYHQGRINYRPYNIEKHKHSIINSFDCAMQCYILATRTDNPLYKALAMQVLSMYLLNDSIMALANKYDRASLRYINEDAMPDSMLAGNLAERSLNIMLTLGDAYNTSIAWRTLAQCYFKIGNAIRAIECLDMALANPETDNMPGLRATVCEMLSLSFAATDNKRNSDYYRNIYLDLQDSIRQDKELEARAISIQESTTHIWHNVTIAITTFLILCIITITLYIRQRRKGYKGNSIQIEHEQERLQKTELNLSNTIRSAVEQRARISVVSGMLPLIDRMSLAIEKRDFTYAAELSEEIDTQNAMLTKWIKLRCGVIQPRIETFKLQSVFDIITKNSSLLSRQGITLEVPETDISVKADKTLTVFILNTLISNARNAINSDDGTIQIECTANTSEHYCEIRVKDNGHGIKQEQIEHLFEYKTINDDSYSKSHGFGLANCRGIMDRYRKLSSLFSVCSISASSIIGRGTTIAFRLPLVLKAIVIIIAMLLSYNSPANATNHSYNDTAARLCDSLYIANIEGRYDDAMVYADSCLVIVEHNDSVDIGIRLSLYNETAVACLALHRWKEYTYYNYLYTNLYKQHTSDNSLATFCQTMERNEQKANIALLISFLLLVAFVPIFWFVYLRHTLQQRKQTHEQLRNIKDIILHKQSEYEHLHLINNITDNQLSTLKHETMYYPTRIRQLISNKSNNSDISNTVSYYRTLYCLLTTKVLNKQLSAYTFPIEHLSVSETFHPSDCQEGLTITANKELMAYLCLLLKRHNGGRLPHSTISQTDTNYVSISFIMERGQQLLPSINVLFSTSTPDVDFLIMRQIIRETTNTSLHYNCGISASISDGQAVITIVLPRATA